MMNGYMVTAIVYIAIQLTIAAFIVVLNSILIIALIKKRSLQTPSNAVLGFLCSSDLIVGIILLSLCFLNISMVFSQRIDEEANLFDAFAKALLGFTGLSSLFMILVNLDRYFAICHPYNYLQHATSKLYAIVSICTFLIYAFVIAVSYVTDITYGTYSRKVILAILLIVTMGFLIYCNMKILGVIRRHRREIASNERQSEEQQSSFQSETKRYRIIFILIILFAICKLPYNSLYLLVSIANIRMTWHVIILLCLSDNLLLLNSILNPVVFCYRVAILRNAVKEIFCCQRPV